MAVGSELGSDRGEGKMVYWCHIKITETLGGPYLDFANQTA